MKFLSSIILLCLLCFNLIKIMESQATTELECTQEYVKEPIYDGTCKNFYVCIDNGMLNPVIQTCAYNLLFDPDEGICTSTIICQQTTTPAPCVRYGRFPIPDQFCKKYYLCYWDGIQYSKIDNLSCPNTLIFNRNSEKCVSPLKVNGKIICP